MPGVCLPAIRQQELPPALGRTGKGGVVAQTLPVPEPSEAWEGVSFPPDKKKSEKKKTNENQESS